jgi:photosystem II stability/assembly factor-like uncharacterized protein
MKSKFISFIIVIALFLSFSTGYSQTDSLIIAPEVMLNGGPLDDFVYFKPGRIIDENTIWFCGYKDNIFTGRESYVFRSVDGGNTFTHNASPIDPPGRVSQMDAFDENIALVALATGKIFRTFDGGVTWDSVYSYNTPGGNAWLDGCRILNDSVAVAFGDGDVNGEMHFCRTDDQGATWTEITTIDYLSAYNGIFTFGLGACNVGESIWCTGYPSTNDTAYVFRSYDAGITWDSYKVADSVASRQPRAVAFTDDNNGLIELSGGSLIKTTDGGATWNSTNNPDTPSSYPNGVTAIPNTDIIINLDDVGVFYTTDLGATWGEIPTTAATSGYNVGGVFLNTDFGYVFTDDGEVLRFKNQLTSISDPFTGQNPEEFHLSQNYPNPFNPVTTIEFSLPAVQFTELKVFNILGTEVASIVADELSQGNHTYQFDGSNLASGVYYYQLNSGTVQDVKKMILLK